ALESFRLLKGIGDMEQRLRSTTLIMRRDLASYEVEDSNSKRLRLSSSPSFLTTTGPASFGFFRIFQGSATTTEGFDGDTIPSFYATNHLLHFTVRRRGNQRTDNFFADIHWDAGASSTPGPPLGWAVNVGSTSGTDVPDARYQD